MLFDKSQFACVLCTNPIFDSGYLWQTLPKNCTGKLNFSDVIEGSTLVHGWFKRGYPNRRSFLGSFLILVDFVSSLLCRLSDRYIYIYMEKLYLDLRIQSDPSSLCVLDFQRCTIFFPADRFYWIITCSCYQESILKCSGSLKQWWGNMVKPP